MPPLFEVVVPTFVNPYLFWIVEKKNLIQRSMFNRNLKMSFNPVINEITEYYREGIIAVQVDNCWARAKIDHVLDTNPGEGSKFVCWLIDYGIMRLVDVIFKIPNWMKQYPGISKQASLHNVVNLNTEMVATEDMEFSLGLRKTLSHVEGTRNVALNHIESAHKLFFSVIEEDEYSLHGDIICVINNNEQTSLTTYLIKQQAVAEDGEMFCEIDQSRIYYKEQYFASNRRWHKPLDKTEIINRSEIIFNEEENQLFPQEYFRRTYADNKY